MQNLSSAQALVRWLLCQLSFLLKTSLYHAFCNISFLDLRDLRKENALYGLYLHIIDLLMSHQSSLCPSFLVASLLVLQGHPQHHLRMPRCLHRVPGRLVPPATVALSAALHPHLALQVRKTAFLLLHPSASWEKALESAFQLLQWCYYRQKCITQSCVG